MPSPAGSRCFGSGSGGHCRTTCIGFSSSHCRRRCWPWASPPGESPRGALLAGLAASLGNTLWETSLQRHIPRRALSRVSAYDWLVSLALAPVGQVLVGPISAGIGIDATLWGAVAIFLSGTVGTLSIREVRELGEGEMRPEIQQQVVHGEGHG